LPRQTGIVRRLSPPGPTMLHQFVKKTDKTPAKEMAVARKRMKECKDADA